MAGYQKKNIFSFQVCLRDYKGKRFFSFLVGDEKKLRWDFSGHISLNPLEDKFLKYYGVCNESNDEGVILHDDNNKETVMIWDIGEVEVLEPTQVDDVKSLNASGYMLISLMGKKLKGNFRLKLQSIGSDKWNLTKERDRFAAMGNHHFSEFSVVSELTLDAIAKKADKTKAYLQPFKEIEAKTLEDFSKYLQKGQVNKRRQVFESQFNNLPLGFKLTNVDAVLYDHAHVLKKDVLSYYLMVSRKIVPFVKDHPVHLKRYSNGVESKPIMDTSFMQVKPKWLSSLPIYGADNEKLKDLILCQNARTLLYLQNYCVLECSHWAGSLESMSNPMYYILKVRANKISLKEYRECLKIIKSVLDEIKLTSYIKTSGIGWQMEVFVPFARKYSFEELAGLSELLKEKLAISLPTTLMFDEKCQDPMEKHIDISTSSNFKKAAIYPPYSLRINASAQVSVPINWQDLDKVRPQNYTIDTLTDEFVTSNTAWDGIFSTENTLNLDLLQKSEAIA